MLDANDLLFLTATKHRTVSLIQAVKIEETSNHPCSISVKVIIQEVRCTLKKLTAHSRTKVKFNKHVTQQTWEKAGRKHACTGGDHTNYMQKNSKMGLDSRTFLLPGTSTMSV